MYIPARHPNELSGWIRPENTPTVPLNPTPATICKIMNSMKDVIQEKFVQKVLCIQFYSSICHCMAFYLSMWMYEKPSFLDGPTSSTLRTAVGFLCTGLRCLLKMICCFHQKL